MGAKFRLKKKSNTPLLLLLVGVVILGIWFSNQTASVFLHETGETFERGQQISIRADVQQAEILSDCPSMRGSTVAIAVVEFYEPSNPDTPYHIEQTHTFTEVIAGNSVGSVWPFNFDIPTDAELGDWTARQMVYCDLNVISTDGYEQAITTPVSTDDNSFTFTVTQGCGAPRYECYLASDGYYQIDDCGAEQHIAWCNTNQICAPTSTGAECIPLGCTQSEYISCPSGVNVQTHTCESGNLVSTGLSCPEECTRDADCVGDEVCVNWQCTTDTEDPVLPNPDSDNMWYYIGGGIVLILIILALVLRRRK